MTVGLSTDETHGQHWLQWVAPDDRMLVDVTLKKLQALPASFDHQQLLWDQLGRLFKEEPSIVRQSRFSQCFSLLADYAYAVRSPQSLIGLFDRDPHSLPILLKALSLGPSITETLLSDPESYELLRITSGRPVTKKALLKELASETKSSSDESQLLRIVERFKHREQLRITFGFYFGKVSIEETHQQFSGLAESILQATTQYVIDRLQQRLGIPMHPSGRPATLSVIAFDGVGSCTQGYCTPLKLMILAECQGRTNSNRIIPNTDFFDRFAKDWINLISSSKSMGLDLVGSTKPLYALQPFIQPFQNTSSVVIDLDQAFQHYDLTGRTWERQTFVGTTYVGGDESAAKSFLDRLQSWIYRRYVGDSDIAGLGAIQRKLRRALESQSAHRSIAVDEKRAACDIEQTVRFLQLLHGHQFPSLRVGSYFESLNRLRDEKILLDSEHDSLSDDYRQFLSAKLAHELHLDPAESFTVGRLNRKQLAESIELSRVIIRQRLETSFPEVEATPEETDLVLDPHPNLGWVTGILQRHRFSQTTVAYSRLLELSQEEGHILSTRRCRFYLSTIAPKLLAAIASTPDPDWTLMNLTRVTSVLGGKGVLWEMLSASPPTLQLVVRICATSEYLVNILTRLPGMIDELMNSLILDRLPDEPEMSRLLEELCRQATDVDSVIRDFKSAMHLQVGVRDVMSKDSMEQTHTALATIAEVCLRQIVRDEYRVMTQKFGIPKSGSSSGSDAEYAIVALGKLGGCEPNYHSDLSIALLFDFEGTTKYEIATKNQPVTSNRHFFEELAQRVMRRVNRQTPKGRLYELNARFGPLGQSSLLAMQIDQFVESFDAEPNSVFQRQTLSKARLIAGSAEMMRKSKEAIKKILLSKQITVRDIDELIEQRLQLERSAGIDNIKRGKGGTLDVEVIVQLLQLVHGKKDPRILVPNTILAIRQMGICKILDEETVQCLSQGYVFLRSVESALRLMDSDARHELPSKPIEIARLASLVASIDGEQLVHKIRIIRLEIRDTFDRLASHLRAFIEGPT